MELERNQDQEKITIRKSDIIKTYKKYREIAKDPFTSEQDKIRAISEIKILDDLFSEVLKEEDFKVKTWEDLVVRDQNVNFLIEYVPGFEEDRKRIIATIQITQILKHPNSHYGKMVTDELRSNSNKTLYVITRANNGELVVSDSTSLYRRSHLLVFETKQIATDFLNNNYQLCDDYLLIYAKR